MTEPKIDKKYYLGKDVLDAILAHMDNVAALPAADVVEVVRCKDCQFCMAFNDKSDGFCGHCRRWLVRTISDCAALVRADGYCSYGERKEVQE